MANTTSEFLGRYFDGFEKTLRSALDAPGACEALVECARMLASTAENGATIYLVGNGGSSAIAEHMAVDLTKNAGLRAIAFGSAATLTTLANDYGYEHVFEQAVSRFGREGDVIVAISSGGTSTNILNACKAARERGMRVITLSGFAADNPLRRLGDVNLFVDSRSYGYVEIIHNLLVHYINDAVIGEIEYVIR